MSNTEDRAADPSQDGRPTNPEDSFRGELQVYELGYLILPSIPEENLSQAVDSLKKIIVSAGGKELDGEAPFKYKLAYAMSKVVGASKYVVNDTYAGWMKFEVDPSRVEEIKKEVEKVSEVLRFLLIKAPRETTFTFAQATKAERDKEAAEAEALNPGESDLSETEEDVIQ